MFMLRNRSCYFKDGWLCQLGIIIAVITGIFGFAGCGTALAQGDTEESVISFGFESDAVSRYVWNGLAFSEGAVWQNFAWASARSFEVSLWSNYGLASKVPGPRMDEIDVAVAYSTSLFNIEFQPALRALYFPDQPDNPNTAELSLNLSYPVGFLTPYTYHSVDIKAYEGAYFGELGVVSSWDINDRASLEIAGGIGWGAAKYNEAYFGYSKNALELVTLDACMTYCFTGSLYIRPHLVVSSLFDNDLKHLVDDPTIFQVGAAVGIEW